LLIFPAFQDEHQTAIQIYEDNGGICILGCTIDNQLFVPGMCRISHTALSNISLLFLQAVHHNSIVRTTLVNFWPII